MANDSMEQRIMEIKSRRLGENGKAFDIGSDEEASGIRKSFR